MTKARHVLTVFIIASLATNAPTAKVMYIDLRLPHGIGVGRLLLQIAIGTALLLTPALTVLTP